MQVNKVDTTKLNYEESLIIKELFNFIIPPSSDKKLPGAAYLCDLDNHFSVQDFSLFRKTIEQISDYANSEYSKDFSKLNTSLQLSLLDDLKKKSKRNFNEIAFRIINYYYTSECVLKAIGQQSHPPFPDGNYVEEGDLSLFEKVYLKGAIYRKC